jgi:hypothetical protein
MGTFKFTTNDGEFEVDAESHEEAAKQLSAFRQHEMNQKFIQQAEGAPWWAKPIMAAMDAGRVGQDVLTQGIAPKLWDTILGTEGDQQRKTAASKNRMGFAGNMGEAALIAGALPSVVPKVVAKVGGGPAIRNTVGTVTGATEGGILGTINSAMHDEDPAQGGATGAISGILGQTVGGIVNKGAKAINQWRTGNPRPLPQYNVRSLPDKPTKLQQVQHANTKAEEAARMVKDPLQEQRAYQEAFKGLDRSKFSPEERALIDRIVSGDLGTKGSGKMGNYMGDKMIALGAGIGSGVPGPEAMAIFGGMLGGAHALKKGSLGGTKEAVDLLRRTQYPNYPAFNPPVGPMGKTRISNVLRQMGLEYQQDDDSPMLPQYWGR